MGVVVAMFAASAVAFVPSQTLQQQRTSSSIVEADLPRANGLRPRQSRTVTKQWSATREEVKTVASPMHRQKPVEEDQGASSWLPVRLEGDSLMAGDYEVFSKQSKPTITRFGAATRRYEVSRHGQLKSVESGSGSFLSFDVGDSKPMSRFDVVLGSLPPDARLLSLARIKRWWMAPSFGNVPLETQFMLAEIPLKGKKKRLGDEDDDDDEPAFLYVLALPLLSDEDDSPSFRCSLWGGDDHKTHESPPIVARCESGDPKVTTRSIESAVWLGALEAPDASHVYRLIDAGMLAASREKSEAFRVLSHKKVARDVVVDGLGWCTWDAFYSEVDARKIELGLESLREKNGVVKRLIIDDGWMQLDREPQAVPADEEPRSSRDEGNALGDEARLMSGETLTGASVGENAAQYLYAASSTDGLIAALRVKVIRLAASILGSIYSSLVEAGRDDSTAVSLWRFFSRRPPLRGSLVEFYDQSTDFTRKIVWPPKPHQDKFGGIEGMKDFVQRVVKQEHGVRSVTCWHAAGGYWGGVDNQADEDDPQSLRIDVVKGEATPHLRWVEPPIAWDPPSLKGTSTPVSSTQISAMYDQLYSILETCGVDAIKADTQSGVAPLGSRYGGGSNAVAMFVAAMESAGERHMRRRDDGIALTNCMCHSTENLYRYAETSVIRASDDFYPREPDSWRFHVTACAYNSVMLGAVALPDYDMFQSKHTAAWLHAAARAVSGGPVTLSDKPGSHDEDVLRALALSDGSTLVAKAPARVAGDCIFDDPSRDGKTALKLVAPNACGSAIVGLFNVQGSYWSRQTRRFEGDCSQNTTSPSIDASFRPADAFPAFDHSLLDGDDLEEARTSSMAPNSEFVAYAFNAQTLVIGGDGEGARDRFDISLGPGEFELLALHRIRRTARYKWTPIGLVEMLNAGGAVVDVISHSHRAEVLVRGFGNFAVYSNKQPAAVTVDFDSVDFSYDNNLITFEIPQGRDVDADTDVKSREDEAPIRKVEIDF